jgi:hypothetical protein
MITAITVLAVYFETSTQSLVVYSVTLWQLLRRAHRPGLVRTALSRIFAALLYEIIGLVAILEKPSDTSVPTSTLVTLAVFVVIQWVWQLNSVLDGRLTRQQGQ